MSLTLVYTGKNTKIAFHTSVDLIICDIISYKVFKKIIMLQYIRFCSPKNDCFLNMIIYSVHVFCKIYLMS